MTELPKITFPVPFDQIPAEVKRLTDFLREKEVDAAFARKMLMWVREGCNHENAEHGYNERDGLWMNACPHCGATK